MVHAQGSKLMWLCGSGSGWGLEDSSLWYFCCERLGHAIRLQIGGLGFRVLRFKGRAHKFQ